MLTLFHGFYSRDLLARHPDKVFCFGDNLKRTGYGGQARACRGAANAYGIPTKRSPSAAGVLRDREDGSIIMVWERNLAHIQQFLDEGRTVFWPIAGIGTGRANLATAAPMLAKRFCTLFSKVMPADAPRSVLPWPNLT